MRWPSPSAAARLPAEAPPRRRVRPTGASAVLCFGLGACTPKSVPAVAQAPASAPSASSVQVVNATVLANHCQDLGRTNAKLAEAAMYRLVEGCQSVPGGSARFEATLRPGGTIAIAAAPGEPETVPICILKHSLTHRVALAAPCLLDVRIEELRVPSAGAQATPGARQ